MSIFLAAAFALAVTLPASAQVFPLPWLQLAPVYLDARPIENVPPVASLAEAAAAQDIFIRSLAHALGPPAGYKAALTHPAAREKLGIDRPVLGRLLAGMLYANGTVVSARYGARPVAEADLLVRVKSADVNTANGDLELLACLDAVIPFIELADLTVAPGVRLDAPTLTAINAGARAGVAGDPIPLSPSQKWLNRLGSFRVELTDSTGTVVGSGTGADLMGHPIAVVRWIRDEVAARGGRLQPGDLLSLGSLAAHAPVTPGLTLRATYTELAGKAAVTAEVSFVEGATRPKPAHPSLRSPDGSP